jgi:hypothetical protein|tara:strand:+ start:53 stop:442 length:390 start_codon:yes stop_codon:yes gene_type:complete
MSSNNSNLTPRARYRALAMIKLGEWWDAREAAFRLAVRTCTLNLEKFLDDDMNSEEALYEMAAAIRLLDSIDDDYLEIKSEINGMADDDGFYKGELFLTNRAACPNHRKVTILPAIKETKKLAPVKDET